MKINCLMLTFFLFVLNKNNGFGCCRYWCCNLDAKNNITNLKNQLPNNQLKKTQKSKNRYKVDNKKEIKNNDEGKKNKAILAKNKIDEFKKAKRDFEIRHTTESFYEKAPDLEEENIDITDIELEFSNESDFYFDLNEELTKKIIQ